MKKIEYYINLLFYSIFCFEKFTTRIMNYCIVVPFVAFFSIFVPKRFHPPGIKHPELRKAWNDISDMGFASSTTFFVLITNTFILFFFILSAINTIIGFKIEIVLIISAISAISWTYLADFFIDKNEKYLKYFHIFEKKSITWKRICLIVAILICIESILWLFGLMYIGHIFYE